MEFEQFIEAFHEVAVDSDHSRHDALRGRVRGDLTAAATVLWGLGVREVTEELAIKAMLAQIGYYQDESHLASEKRTEFMDFADTMGLTASTMDLVARDVARSVLRKFEQDGVRHVENESGFYLFRISEEDVK